MHPCELTDEKLLAACETIRQRRSGPGGQHRNKVETAIRLEHHPSGLCAQASERRSQAENLQQAIFRLRIELALKVRSERPDSPSELWKQRSRGGKISVNPAHADFPRMLAEALDHLEQKEWDLPATAALLGVSGSQLVKFLKLEPQAFQLLNAERQSRGLRPLS